MRRVKARPGSRAIVSGEVRCLCRGLKKSYGRKSVLRDCSFSLRAGEMAGVMGENGSGKTTLVRCLLGFTKPSAGTVSLSPAIGYCPQDNFLHGRYTLSEHLRLAGTILGARGSVDPEYVRRLVDRLKLAPYRGELISRLSSGTCQKVKFLTSILHRPGLIILDEPTDGFDWGMYLAYWDIVSELRNAGAAVLMISHFLYDRERFDTLYELREGILEEASLGGPGLPA